MPLTKSQLAAENAALRSERDALRYLLNQHREASKIVRAQRLRAARVAQRRAATHNLFED